MGIHKVNDFFPRGKIKVEQSFANSTGVSVKYLCRQGSKWVLETFKVILCPVYALQCLI